MTGTLPAWHPLACALYAGEYNHPTYKRYYSQTNSCAACGVELKLFDDEKKELSSNSEFIVGQVIYSLLHEILFC
ncbi:hypothetical protein BH11BAC5_BH11BAC5_38970 [soil metagenome]